MTESDILKEELEKNIKDVLYKGLFLKIIAGAITLGAVFGFILGVYKKQIEIDNNLISQKEIIKIQIDAQKLIQKNINDTQTQIQKNIKETQDKISKFSKDFTEKQITFIESVTGKQAEAEAKLSNIEKLVKQAEILDEKVKTLESLKEMEKVLSNLKTKLAKDPQFKSDLKDELSDEYKEIQIQIDKIKNPEDWRTPQLQNGWVMYNKEYNQPGYFKDSQGIVHLKGMVKNGKEGTVIFRLPDGYKPSRCVVKGAIAYHKDENTYKMSRIDITFDGRVIFSHSTWVSLDGITFRAGH